jgi:hypothetical protein
MALKPEISIPVGLATAALVYAVYSNATPSITEIRAAKPMDTDVEASRKLAAWTSAGIVGGVSLVAKDPTIFIIGGSMVIVLDWWHRHANAVDPMTGKATVAGNKGGTLPVETQESSPESFAYADDMQSAY